MNHLGYYEQALGMGEEQSYYSRLGSTIATAAVGGWVAKTIAPDVEKKSAMVGGALASIALAAVGEAVLPLGGALWDVPYWVRGIMFSGGAGALVGVHLKNQFEREMQYAFEMRQL